ncbi:hypothetical protein K1719_014611 [Acacia pycnantha]|nr:hypothetical protein K1719_014611 [Acacia pycnantha]
MEHNYDRSWIEICASELNVEKLRHLEASMPITLCKLEMVFPPSLFDSMEHLPVHPPEMISRWRGVPRNDDAGDTRDQKSIFNFPGESWENVLGQLLTEEISE